MNNPKMTSYAFQCAKRSVKDNKVALKRLNTLLIRILTRIEKISIFLGEEELDEKELKSKITLLSSLLTVKKQLNLDIKDLGSKDTKTSSSLKQLLS